MEGKPIQNLCSEHERRDSTLKYYKHLLRNTITGETKPASAKRQGGTALGIHQGGVHTRRPARVCAPA